MEELYPPIPNWDRNLFECPDSIYRITYFGKTEDSDSIIFWGGYDFQILPQGYFKSQVLNSKGRKQKPEYFYFVPNTLGRKYGWMQDCDKNGKVHKKISSRFFERISTTSLNGDSIVDRTSWRVFRRDTTCDFIYRYVYRNEKLIEYWSDSPFNEKINSWDDRESYHVMAYSYPTTNVKVTESYSVKNGTRKLNSSVTELSYFSGDTLVGVKTTVDGFKDFEKTEKYFYRKGFWYRTETWKNGVLDSYIEKIPLREN